METLNKRDLFELGRKVSESFRLGYEGEANSALVVFIDRLLEYMTYKKINSQPQLNTVFTTLLEAQKRRDVLYIADIIEYEIIPILKHI